jgi:hypothetical protein
MEGRYKDKLGIGLTKQKTKYSGGFLNQDLELETLLLGARICASGVNKTAQPQIIRLQAGGITELTEYREKRIWHTIRMRTQS